MTQFAAATHPGLIRKHNEDCYGANPELGLWLVADGMGGHANGEVAAAIVRDTLGRLRGEDCGLVESIMRAHRAILEEIGRERSRSNMGSTVVALVLQGDAYEIAWVGDSRAYLFDSNLRQLTRDHSPVADLLASGAINAAQAAQHADRHVLNQSLGVSESVAVTPGHIKGRLQPGQQLLLCSDGLTDELNDQDMAAILRERTLPQEQVDGLIEAALEAGGHDNITVVLVGDPNAEPVPSDQEKSGYGEVGDRDRAHDSKVLLLAAMVLAVLAWLAFGLGD